MHVKPIKLTDLLFGGVASNKGLRYRLQQLCEDNNIHLSIPSPKLCTDNAKNDWCKDITIISQELLS